MRHKLPKPIWGGAAWASHGSLSSLFGIHVVVTSQQAQGYEAFHFLDIFPMTLFKDHEALPNCVTSDHLIPTMLKT
jgi:hypothetical protein